MGKAVLTLIGALLFGSVVLFKIVIIDHPDMSWMNELVKRPATRVVYQGECLVVLDNETGQTLNVICPHGSTYQHKSPQEKEIDYKSGDFPGCDEGWTFAKTLSNEEFKQSSPDGSGCSKGTVGAFFVCIKTAKFNVKCMTPRELKTLEVEK